MATKWQNPASSFTSYGGRKLLVAIDFGTTYSAAAWVLTRSDKRNPDTYVVDKWPDKADTEQKVPTKLHYDGPSGLMSSSPSRWGFEIRDSDDYYEWFKLELDPALGKYRKYVGSAVKPHGKNEVEKLITDYLRALRMHVESRVLAHFRTAPKVLSGVTWEYIITVPAIWPKAAQHTTMDYARKAGMNPSSSVPIITEPEAAGIYALENMSRELTLEVGDTFVICDAGGGTVDLITYTVASLKPIPRLEESAPGTGDLCGSTFLDREFDRWLQHRFSGFAPWDKRYHKDALEYWESEIKRNFTGDSNRTPIFHIRARGLPDTPYLGIKDGLVEMTAQEVMSIFEPVISKILALVRSQIAYTNKGGRNAKAVLLAGGFGKNEYLKSRIQKDVGKTIIVERMRECNTAIVRGALVRGLAGGNSGLPIIASRRARQHFGVAALTEYDPSKHDWGRSRIPGGLGGKDRIEVMKWYKSIGDKLTEDESVKFDYYYDMKVAEVQQQGGRLDMLTMVVYISDEDLSRRPMYPDWPKCRQLVRLPSDLNLIPKNSLQTERTADGTWYYKIPFSIHMNCYSAHMVFELFHGGQRISSIRQVYPDP